MIQWRTERRKVADLKDYANNPRQFTDKGMADLKASLERLGYIDPIAINQDGTIIGGHARKRTLLALGLTEVDVRIPDVQLTDKQVQEAVIRLNRNTAGAWDFHKLEAFFNGKELIDWGFEVAEIKWGQPDLFNDIDAETPLPPSPVTLIGDVWVCGEHRIMCGDATIACNVDRLLAGIKPHLMVTDPPYGVDYDPAWRDAAAKRSPSMGNRKDTAKGAVQNDTNADWRAAWAMFPGAVAYVWHAGKYAALVQASLEYAEFEIRSQIIWAKSHLAIGRGNYHWQHEPCWYAVREGATAHWAGDRKQTTLWQIDKPQKSETGHSTQKPVECMRRPIVNNSKPGDAVYDPFLGSGTTMIAAEITGRKCLAMELNPAYVDVAVARWQKLTGKKAHCEGTRKTLEGVQVPKARKANAKRVAAGQ